MCICNAPDGTLGDPSAAIKLLESIKDKYPMEADVYLFVKAEKVNHEKVKGIIPEGMSYIIKDGVIDSNAANEVLKMDAVIIFPTAHFLDVTEYKAIKAAEKPMFVANEYDFDRKFNFTTSDQFSPRKRWDPVYPPVFDSYFYTGLSGKEEKLGVFLSEDKESHSLSKMTDSDGVKLRNLLFDSDEMSDLEQRELNYFNSHDLYFGYFNNIIGAESNKFKTTPMAFLDFCIERSKEKDDKHIIDIIMPVKHGEKNNNGVWWNTTSVEQMFEHLKKYDLDRYTFEFYEKKDDNLTCTEKMGGGPTVVRIINSFPFSANSMKELMHASSPFVLVTGNQSLFEAISYKKIPFYQVMLWTTLVPASLVAAAAKYLGEGSLLHEYFQSFYQSSKININQFLMHEKELLEQIEKFNTIILEKENLGDNFPEKIMDFLQNEEHYTEHVSRAILNRKDLNVSTPLERIYTDMIIVEFFSRYHESLKAIGFDPILWAIERKKYNIKILEELIKKPDFINEDNMLHYQAYKMTAEINAKQSSKAKENEAGEPWFKIEYTVLSNNSAKITIIPGDFFEEKEDCNMYYSLMHQKLRNEIIETLTLMGADISKILLHKVVENLPQYSDSRRIIEIEIDPRMLHHGDSKRKRPFSPGFDNSAAEPGESEETELSPTVKKLKE